MQVFAKIFILRKNEAENWTFFIEDWFSFRCNILSVKLLVFGVNTLLDTNRKVLRITELRN